MTAIGFRRRIHTLTISATMVHARWRWLEPMLEAAKRPEVHQWNLLRGILQENSDTEFGRAHGFNRIGSVEEWRKAVPVRSFDDLRPWIDRQAETGARALTVEPPVMYNMTSGTTSQPKLIPITSSGVRRIERQQRLIASILHSRDPLLFSGRLVGIGGPAIEGRLSNGTPYGSVTGLIFERTPRALRARYVLPPEVAHIADYDIRYRVIATLLLSAPDVTFATTANPSTFMRLLAVANANMDSVLSDISSGAFSIEIPLPKVEREMLLGSFRPQPARAAYLANLASRGKLQIEDCWPRLRGIAVWTGGSCGIPLAALQQKLRADIRIAELGYVASEFRGTINVDPDRNLCLPTLGELFFEFVPESDTTPDERTFLGLHELEYGHRYRVIATTQDGLYRYDINDIVQVVGQVQQTPALAFVQKGRGVTNITGEKVHESQMSEAVVAACGASGFNPVFYVALADEAAGLYRVYLELDEGLVMQSATMTTDIDRELCRRNVEYKAKRDSKRLLPPVVVQLREGTAENYRRHCVSAGQRDSQFKVMPLRYAREMTFDFARWQVEA